MVSGNSNEDIERGENIFYCSNQVGKVMLEREITKQHATS
jgi:hypothetical protein